LSETPAIDIYRSALPPGGPAQNKLARRPIDTIPADRVDSYKTGSRIDFRDELDPAELARQPGEEVVYTIRTRLSGEHASGDSNTAKLAMYPAPPAPGELRATLMERSVALSWMSPGTPPAATSPNETLNYRVYRAEVSAGSTAGAEPNDSTGAAQAALQPIALVHSNAYDDTNVAVGRTYRYVVRAVAKFGEQSVESLDSNDAIIAANDRFPPTTPQNLVAVIIPATNGQPSYVELSWSISAETDLAGYRVFRSNEPDTQGERLNVELLSAPTYRDVSAMTGQRYFYRVRAVDQAGNESPLSASVEAIVEP
jgi:hypothetical protein